jgi:hypothetical protein
MLANGTRIIHDVSGAGTCQESEKMGEVLVTFDNGTTSVVKLSAMKFAPKYKVVFANGEECYPRATDRRDAEHAARALQSAQGRPVGNVPVMHCEPYALTSQAKRTNHVPIYSARPRFRPAPGV